MRRARWKRKNVRRVGPHKCGPPAAGGGRLALPRGNQGRKRATLGVIQARGSPGYLPLRFYPQGVRRISPQGGRDISVARRSRERLSSVRRQSRKRLRSRCLPLRGPWSGSGFRSRGHAIFHPDDRQAGKRGRVVWILEGSGASRQKTGSLYRNRFGRPPSRREPRKKRPFLLDRPRPIFFSTRRKRKWGVEWTGYHHSRIPRAAGCRPYTSPRESHRREPVWGRPQSSHSPLWASHHAGNAGSFGERVTGILYLKPEFPFRVNGEIVFEPTPKWKNCKREPLFIVQISPR